MSNHQKIGGTERFLLGLAISVILFLLLWSYVYALNDEFLPIAK
jgi:hypothetical protein